MGCLAYLICSHLRSLHLQLESRRLKELLGRLAEFESGVLEMIIFGYEFILTLHRFCEMR